MMIKDVKVYSLAAPIRRLEHHPESYPFKKDLANVMFDSYKATLVEVTADDGTSGIGECMTRGAPTATRAIVEELLSRVVIGTDPFDVELSWQKMYGIMRQRGHVKGFMIEAISGVDTAIWDLLGKVTNKPVCKLLGGRFRGKVRAYASSLRWHDQETLAEKAVEYAEQGFTAIKMKIGRGVEQDIEAVRILRDAVGWSIDIMVDANSGYDVNSAIRLGKKLEKYEISWFEEPLPPDEIECYVKVAKALDIPVAAGESEYTRYGFKELISRSAVDIIQPNVARAGGFTEVRKILAIADAFGIPYAPHTGSSSGVCMAAELQLSAYAPRFMIYEYMIEPWSAEEPNPLRDRILKEPVEIFSDGYLQVPDRPGIGVALNKPLIEKYAYVGKRKK